MELTVGFAKKSRPQNHAYDFETEEASIYFKGEVPDELGDEERAAIDRKAAELFATAKVRVLCELGLPYQVEVETGIVSEVKEASTVQAVTAAFPGTVAEAPAVAAAVAPALPAPAAPFPTAPAVALPAPAPPAGVLPPPPAGALPPAAPAAAGGAGQLVALFMQDPSQWWDNRATKTNPKGPDFKHKSLPDPKNPQYKASLWIRDFKEAGYSV